MIYVEIHDPAGTHILVRSTAKAGKGKEEKEIPNWHGNNDFVDTSLVSKLIMNGELLLGILLSNILFSF